MQFYFREEKPGLVYLYYAVTNREFEYIVNHQYKLFPVRFFTRTHLCPTLNKEYALRIASERANWKPDVKRVHVLRFMTSTDAIKKYIKGDASNTRATISIPQADVVSFNKHIIGYIECVDTSNLIDSANELA